MSCFQYFYRQSNLDMRYMNEIYRGEEITQTHSPGIGLFSSLDLYVSIS